MKPSREPRQKVLSFKTTTYYRRAVELIAAKRAESSGRRWSLTDVMELALKDLVRKEKVSV